MAFFLVLAPLPWSACSSSAKDGSIGVVLGRNKHTGALHVRDVPPGRAGDSAGLHAGDRIKMIDGWMVDRLSPERVRELLRGPNGTDVILTIVRGETVVHLTVTREPLSATRDRAANPAPANPAPANPAPANPAKPIE